MRTLIIADNQDITKAGILYLSDRMPALVIYWLSAMISVSISVWLKPV